MFATMFVHPADLMKTRVQVTGRPAAEMIKVTLKESGPTGFYRGLSAALMRQAVYGTARLGLHRSFSNYMLEAQGGGQLPAYKSVLSSMASGAIGSFIGNPMDLSLVRMQTDATRPPETRRNYKHVFDALVRIVREEGVLSLWRGSTPTVARAMSVNVGMMASFDQIKYLVVSARGGADDFTTRVISAGFAGFACAFTSLPFDRIKVAMQDMKAEGGRNPYSGFLDCGRQLIAKDGFFQLWRGYAAYSARCAPHAIITLLTMNTFVELYTAAFLPTPKHTSPSD